MSAERLRVADELVVTTGYLRNLPVMGVVTLGQGISSSNCPWLKSGQITKEEPCPICIQTSYGEGEDVIDEGPCRYFCGLAIQYGTIAIRCRLSTRELKKKTTNIFQGVAKHRHFF